MSDTLMVGLDGSDASEIRDMIAGLADTLRKLGCTSATIVVTYQNDDEDDTTSIEVVGRGDVFAREGAMMQALETIRKEASSDESA